MKLAIISALSRNRVIGRNGKLPWHIPEDLRRFKKLTHGHPVLMGRKTFEAMKAPLAGRRNIVLSSKPVGNIETYRNIPDAVNAVSTEDLVFVIGGGEIYMQMLESVDLLYLTIIDRDVEGDAFFPPYQHLIGTMYESVFFEQHEGFLFNDFRRIDQAGPPTLQ